MSNNKDSSSSSSNTITNKDGNNDNKKIKVKPNPMVQKYWLELNKTGNYNRYTINTINNNHNATIIDSIAYSIFNISKEDIVAEVTMEDDVDLLNFALESIEYETGKLDWVVGRSDYKPPHSSTVTTASSSSSSASSSSSSSSSHGSSSHDKDKNNIKDRDPDSVMFLSKLPDGVFVSGATSMALNRHRADFALYGNGIFYVLRNEFLDDTILSTMREPTYVPPQVRYSEDKLSLVFIDSLTYPRPVRKFKMLFGKSSLLGFLRDMMISEVGLEDRDALVLLTKGKKIPNTFDTMALDAIGIKTGQKIIISRRLGVPQEPHNGMTERNRQFVGDLLFGPAGDQKSNANGLSISKTFKTSHGYQILGRTIERLLMVRFSDAYRKEEGARKSEEELYALLEEEDREKAKEKQKKEKKKEKEKEKKKKEQQEKKEQADQKKSNDKKSNDKGKDKEKDKVKEENDDGSSSDEDAWIMGIRRGHKEDMKSPVKNAINQTKSSNMNITSNLSEEQQLQAALRLSLAEAKQQEEEVIVKSRQKKKKKDDISNNVKPVNPPPVPIKSTPLPQPVIQKKLVPPPAPAIVKDIKPVSSIVMKDGEKPKYSQVTSQSVSAVGKKPTETITAPSILRSGNTTNASDSKLQSNRINAIPEPTKSDILNGISSLRVTSDKMDTKTNDLSYLNTFFPPNTFSQSIPGLIDNFLGAPITNDAQINRTSTPPLSSMAPPGLGLGLGTTTAPPGLGLGLGTTTAPPLGVGSTSVNFCPSCGSKLQQSHRFCYNCGSDIKTYIAEVAPDSLSSAGRLSGILGDNNLYKQSTTTAASTIAASPFLDTWNLPMPTSQPMSIPGLSSSSQANFSMKEDLSFNVFGTKDTSDSDILAINSMLTSDAPPFIPASLKTQANAGLNMSSKSTSSTWEDPSLSSSFGNVGMLMSFLGDDDASKAPTVDQKSQKEKETSRLGMFNKGGYI